ncbi:MAG: hypothetical protein CMJ90_19875 [Planctomycetes bacterium]|nr:hypothetical protein [Planctomycetota bacterium]
MVSRHLSHEKTQFQSRRRKNSIRTAVRSLQVESLEDRRLLAVDAFNDEFIYFKADRPHSKELPVLHNDNGERIRVVEVGEADHGGRVRIVREGTMLAYSPRPEFEGTETFEYAIRAPNGESDVAKVEVLVTRPAVIAGTNWADKNGDGERQEGEHGIPGWVIYLDQNNNGELDRHEPAKPTDPRGEYRFVVPPGEYTVAETHPAGWEQTVPESGTYRVNLEGGDVADRLDFANQRLGANLHGMAWADHNGDGERQEREPGLANWVVYLDSNKNGSHDEGEPAKRTDPHGRYHFAVEAGEYVVAQVNRPGWEQTAPENGSYSVNVGPGESVDRLVFGNQPAAARLHGVVWADHNGDGERQEREPGLPNWGVYLDSNRNGAHDEGEPATRTDSHGRYHFVVEAGAYTVAEARRPGWEQTTPEGGTYSVEVGPGDVVDGLAFGNRPQVSTIRGAVWADHNGDGERQEREPGLPNWIVYLDSDKNGSHDEGEPATRTDPHGRYHFVVEAGEYTVAEVNRRGWEQTAPENGSYSVNVEPGQHADGLDFGNQPLAARLHGVVWADPNGDGERQEREPGLPNWGVYLDANKNGSHDEGEPATRTDSHGRYHFVVEAGAYTVAEAHRPGWEQTAPEGGTYSIEVEPGDVVEGLIFGNQPQISTLNGVAWADRNGDGERQEGERGIPNWIVYLDSNKDGSHDEGEPATRTDPHGRYHFVVDAGEYNVAQVSRRGWEQTAPENGSYTVEVEPGERVDGLDFGNQPLLGAIHGIKWFDRNGNAERGPREPGLPGWRIYLDLNDNAAHDEQEPITRTNRHGHYQFPHVEPGEYVVREVQRRGWEQTAPEEGYHRVTVEPGDVLHDVSFGNRLIRHEGSRGRFNMQFFNEEGQPVNQLMQGEQFYAGIFVEDLRETPRGASAAHLDLVFDDDVLKMNGELQYGGDFEFDRSGGESDGILRQVGADAGEREIGDRPALLARVPYRAMQGGEFTFDPIPTEDVIMGVKLVGEDDMVPIELIEFTSAVLDVVTNPYVNPIEAMDVNHDGNVTPFDAFAILNDFSEHGARKLTLPEPGDDFSGQMYIDVNMDGRATPVDILTVINYLNVGGGEGEAALLSDAEPSVEVPVFDNLRQTGIESTDQATTTSIVFDYNELFSPSNDIPIGVAEEMRSLGKSAFDDVDDSWNSDDLADCLEDLMAEFTGEAG